MFPYINLKRRPKKNEIIATFYLEPEEGSSMEELANGLAAESSVGTWTKLSTLTGKIFRDLGACVFYIDKKEKIIKVSYPLALFEKGNIAQLLSTVSGNIFSLKEIKNLRLVDIDFPAEYINSFLGPKFGANGARKIYGVYKRPVVGSIIKPKVGLSPSATAELAYQVFKNGVDLIKDDETLTDMLFCRFEERVEFVVRATEEAEKETGKKKVFVFNVTAPSQEMVRRAKLVKKRGGKGIMVDILTAGFSSVQELRKENEKMGLIIHGHRASHSIFTKKEDWGVSMLVLAKIARLAGVDQLHTGTVVGKMEGRKEEILAINKFLGSKFGKLKPVLPVASGGLRPGLIPSLIKILGKNLIINFGGGIHGHPKGSAVGAKAAYQSVIASSQGISLEKYSQSHLELKEALDYWREK